MGLSLQSQSSHEETEKKERCQFGVLLEDLKDEKKQSRENWEERSESPAFGKILVYSGISQMDSGTGAQGEREEEDRRWPAVKWGQFSR